jgi:hypothetical protein
MAMAAIALALILATFTINEPLATRLFRMGMVLNSINLLLIIFNASRMRKNND